MPFPAMNVRKLLIFFALGIVRAAKLLPEPAGNEGESRNPEKPDGWSFDSFKTPANALFDNFIPLLDFSSVDVADGVFVSVVQWV